MEYNNESEPRIYFSIRKLSQLISYGQMFASRNEQFNTNIDLNDIRSKLRYCHYQTQRFGVIFNGEVSETMSYLTDSYRDWYKFWNEYFNSFTREQRVMFEKMYAQNSDLTDFCPEGTWVSKQLKLK